MNELLRGILVGFIGAALATILDVLFQNEDE